MHKLKSHDGFLSYQLNWRAELFPPKFFAQFWSALKKPSCNLLHVFHSSFIVYFLEQFQRFSWALQPLKYILKCFQLISSSDNKKILLTTSRNVRLDSGGSATKYHCFLTFYFILYKTKAISLFEDHQNGQKPKV